MSQDQLTYALSRNPEESLPCHCATCRFFCPPESDCITTKDIGRCKYNPPTADGWPFVYQYETPCSKYVRNWE